MPTVFSHVIQKRFSQVNEDVATDALAYILESSEAARRGIQNLIHAVSPDMPDLTFKTQQTEGSIRPDMCGVSNSEPRVYIKNKFWAGLRIINQRQVLVAQFPQTGIRLFVAYR